LGIFARGFLFQIRKKVQAKLIKNKEKEQKKNKKKK
jgi:hypothetical protein